MGPHVDIVDLTGDQIEPDVVHLNFVDSSKQIKDDDSELNTLPNFVGFSNHRICECMFRYLVLRL